MALFDPTSPTALPHAGTFNNNTLTMNVGHVAMTEIYTPAACAELNARGDRLRERLNDLFMRYQVKMKAMGQGSMVVIHPTAGAINTPHDIEETDKRLRQLLFLDLLEQGIYMAERGFMALSLMVRDEDCATIFGIGSSLSAMGDGHVLFGRNEKGNQHLHEQIAELTGVRPA